LLSRFNNGWMRCSCMTGDPLSGAMAPLNDTHALRSLTQSLEVSGLNPVA
jgi:hypothetical protein